MDESPVVVGQHEAGQGSLTSYTAGFLISLALTLVAFLLVLHHLLTGWAAAMVIVGLALMQLAVQLIFFLHLGHESRPRWNLTVFLFMIIVVIILVFGSLWIMSNLSYHMRTPQNPNTYIVKDEGFQK